MNEPLAGLYIHPASHNPLTHTSKPTMKHLILLTILLLAPLAAKQRQEADRD